MSLAHQLVPRDESPAEMAFHPLADLFPLMADAEFEALVEDIREHGQLEMIVTLGGKILDGRNRYRACKQIGITPKTVEWSGVGSAQAFVVSHNLHRRHLNESQRAMIAAKLAQLPQGRKSQAAGSNKENGNRQICQFESKGVPIAAAAEMLNVSERTVRDARTVLKRGTPEELKEVEAGEQAASTIAKKIHAAVPPEKRKRGLKTDKDEARKETQRANARLWSLLRDALENLTSLPRPLDVVRAVRAIDHTKKTDAKLLPALQWLTEFSDAWTSPDAEANPRGKNNSARKAKADHRQEGAEGSPP